MDCQLELHENGSSVCVLKSKNHLVTFPKLISLKFLLNYNNPIQMTNVLTHSKFILLNGSEVTGFDPQIGFKNKSLFIWFFDLVRFCTYGTSLSNDNLFFVYIQKVVICETLLDSFNVKTVESRMISTKINTHY